MLLWPLPQALVTAADEQVKVRNEEDGRLQVVAEIVKRDTADTSPWDGRYNNV